jgi:glycosyltransferase involved in cell wall biosynthesis
LTIGRLSDFSWKGDESLMRDLAITAIIPLYNGGEFIREALESVLAQLLPPAKIIVVNDGSTDNGPDIVAAIAREHPICLIHKENGGQSSARNLGVAHTTTPLIALLDQDDIWYPNHLRELVKPFREEHYPPLGWVYGNLDEIDRLGAMVTRSCLDQLTSVEHPKRTLRGCLAHDMFVVPTSALISRAALEAVGGFDERLIGYEDDDLFLRMFRHGYGNVYLRESLAKWRIFPGSTSWSPSMRRSRMIYVRKLLETFPPGEVPGSLYWRALLAPRFFPMLLLEYVRAARVGAPEDLCTAVDDLGVIVPYLTLRSRFVLRAALRVMRYPLAARLFVRLTDMEPPVLKRIYRRIANRP